MAESVVLCFVPENEDNDLESNDQLEASKLQPMKNNKLRKSR